MPSIEITRSLNLTLDECVRADLHSFLNITNVLYEECHRLGEALGDPHLLAGAEACVELLTEFSTDPHRALEGFSIDLDDLERHILELAGDNPRTGADVEVILSIMSVFRDRAAEFGRDRLEWSKWTPDALFQNLAKFLDTTALLSRGRFHVVYTPDSNTNRAYQLDFRINPPGEEFRAPLVFFDVLRDLVANARKYSAPPAAIEVVLWVDAAGMLDLRVTDEGIGIPVEEIERVIEPGFRASNAVSRRTLGGGLGLTKAYLTAKRFQGRFWVDAEPGKGTTVRLTMLPPVETLAGTPASA